ncbi:MAG: DUF3099 domain-containing protein [Nocardioides sp.]
MTQRRTAGPVRVTTAPVSRAEELAGRQRRYLISMAIRTACFVGAVVADGWLRWVLVAGAVLLPYVAVVVANAEGRRDDGYLLDDPGPATRVQELPSAGDRVRDTP